MNDQRIARLVEQYTTQNITLEDLGQQEGLTRERIRQLLMQAGVTAKDSQRRLSASVIREKAKRERRDSHCRHSYGCDFATIQKITGHAMFRALRAHPLIQKWWLHKNNATRYHVGWTLTLPEYAELVGPRLYEIGLKKGGLVLGRKDKSGPFSKENCELVTLELNSSATRGYINAHLKRRAVAKRNAALARQMYDDGKTAAEIAKALKKRKATINMYLSWTK